MFTAVAPVPKCSDIHSPRPRLKHEPRPHYRPFMFSDKDLQAIDTIQRLTIRDQNKPKQAVSMAAAVRNAIREHAAQLKRKASKWSPHANLKPNRPSIVQDCNRGMREGRCFAESHGRTGRSRILRLGNERRDRCVPSRSQSGRSISV